MMYPQNNLKLDLLQANSYKLSSVLAELEQRPKPNHPCSNCIFKWKEKVKWKRLVIFSLGLLGAMTQSSIGANIAGNHMCHLFTGCYWL